MRSTLSRDACRGYLKKGELKLLIAERFEPVVALLKHKCLYLLSKNRARPHIHGKSG